MPKLVSKASVLVRIVTPSLYCSPYEKHNLEKLRVKMHLSRYCGYGGKGSLLWISAFFSFIISPVSLLPYLLKTYCRT